MAKKWGVSKLLLAAAVVVFVLAAVGVKLGTLDLVALGLALGFASFVIERRLRPPAPMSVWEDCELQDRVVATAWRTDERGTSSQQQTSTLIGSIC